MGPRNYVPARFTSAGRLANVAGANNPDEYHHLWRRPAAYASAACWRGGIIFSFAGALGHLSQSFIYRGARFGSEAESDVVRHASAGDWRDPAHRGTPVPVR